MDLIERETSLSALHSGFDKINSGEGHCYFIIGEAGIGKTSLVKTFLKETQHRSYQYTGSCDSLFTPRPLAPVHDLMLQLKDDENNATSLSQSHKQELFTDFLQHISHKNKPVILVFEDIHWADEATLDFVKFIARRISRLRCMFLLTFRDNEIHAKHPLRNVLGELSLDTYTRMALQPLSREVVYTMSEAKGYDPHHVYNISGGNPFYVNEILASYSPGIPDTIKDSIISVYNTTSEATQEVWRILSVIPEGMELNRLTEIQPVWKEAIGNCLQKKILVIENDKAVFKHDLYRMAVEESLPLFQRVELNKNILDLFLTSFEEAGEIERIVHYATNAKEFNVVACYAPIAAKQAALHGSHGEAAKLYRLAIEHTDAGEIETVELYESYAYECYLTNQINEAIVYQRKALYIREEQRDHTQTGNCLRFLSRLWWFQGNSINAENYAIRAIEILKDQPDSKEKAMAYSNMAQLKMLADRSTECISWGDKAIALATALNDNETLAHALNTVGSALMTLPGSTKKGIEFLQKSLDIALKNSYHEHVARAYTALGSNAVTMKDYAFAEKHLNNGIDYCEIRNLDALRLYMIGWKSRLLLEKGNWKEAYDLANCLLQKDNLLPVIKVVALVIAGTVKMRKGDANAITLLEEAKNISFETNELQRILPALSALLEYEWINDQTLVENSLLEKVITLITASEKIVTKSKFYYWLRKRRSDQFILTAWEEKKQTTFKEEVSFWKELGCAYEQALRLSEGNDDDKRAALSIMETLGADAVCAKLKMEMRNAGIKKIPRGSRQSTKQNPAGLTVRELEILQFLKEGAQNKEIAAGLFIAPKTVDNHIAKVLFKLDVKTRMKAVQEADRLGIL